MNKRIWLAALTLTLAACVQQPPPTQPASAPAGPPVRVRGTVDRLDGNTLVVGTRQGTPAVVTLAPNYVVRTVVRRKLTDIKTGDFLASTAVRGKDGKLHAIEVHIFLPAQRGVVPELQAPWDLVPNSVMTNAVVTGIVNSKTGRDLKLAYKGTPTEVVVGPNIPIVTYAPGDPSMLQPGKAVFIIAQKAADGSLSSANVTVENKGVKPPM